MRKTERFALLAMGLDLKDEQLLRLIKHIDGGGTVLMDGEVLEFKDGLGGSPIG